MLFSPFLAGGGGGELNTTWCNSFGFTQVLSSGLVTRLVIITLIYMHWVIKQQIYLLP